MTVYSLDVLLFLFGTSLLFHVQFELLPPDLHTDFSRGGQVVWYSHLSQNCPQFIVIHTVKGFSIVNKAEIDVFLELSCFFGDPADVGNLTLGSIIMNKASGGERIPVELFQILKDNVVKVLHSICQQIWKTRQCSGLEKVCFHSNPKKGNAKECSNYCTIAVISHARKVMLKILKEKL